MNEESHFFRSPLNRIFWACMNAFVAARTGLKKSFFGDGSRRPQNWNPFGYLINGFIDTVDLILNFFDCWLGKEMKPLPQKITSVIFLIFFIFF